MSTFENPVNHFQEKIGLKDVLGVLFFGVFYLLIKGLWGHVALWCMVVLMPGLLDRSQDGQITVLVIAVVFNIVYAFLIPSILKRAYLKRGWSEIVVSGTRSIFVNQASKVETKKCPFCAEEVKFDAIKCKHCQSDLS